MGEKITKIEPVKQKLAFEHSALKRVCAYCRVSTGHAEQRNSFEAQVQFYLNQDFIKEPVLENSIERKLTLQIGELLAGQSCDAQEVKQLAFRRAAAQYQMLPLDDRTYQNEKIIAALEDLPQQTECNMTLLEQTIRRIVVKKQTGLQFYLKNGRSITIPIGEGAY